MSLTTRSCSAFLVELRVKGHDAAVGLLQLAAEAVGLELAFLQLGEVVEEGAVLLAQRRQRVAAAAVEHLGDGLLHRGGQAGRGLPVLALGQAHRRARGGGLDVELVDQPPRTGQAGAAARREAALPAEHGLQVGNAGAAVLHGHDEAAGQDVVVQLQQYLAAAGVVAGVAGDLGHRRGDACLPLAVQPQQLGHAHDLLPRRGDVLARGDRQLAEPALHGCSSRVPTTVVSSRPRAWSR
ncbi:hypothetical protein LXT12_00515 [Pelomonas sp. P7]|uniref:Uncharacterized protein n=1 Tax=Pelomonas caseinilytica TaxID=2906763 RepID=A0ABS8X5Y7_9BURK|nr:hypothetical protein [Pelomonas sp. P7]MCE4535744.1 hypothetical protein [Pelomonas sp. P7]